MKFLKNFDWSFKSIAKALGALLLIVLALGLIVSVIGFAYRGVAKVFPQIQYGGDDAYSKNSMGYAGVATDSARSESPGFFDSSAIMPPYQPEPPTGSDAEEFEVKNYTGTIQTGELDGTCDKIASLKERKDVIFESSDKNRDGCYYRFKVEKEKDQEIVDLIQSLDPDYFNSNVRSIKGSVEGVESELEILNKKLTSIEETLEKAQSAYDEITALATEQKDTVTLATIINNKLQLIQQLSQERLYVKETIDRYNQSKSDQLDQLSYTFFDINVQKMVVADWKSLKDSWKTEAQAMVKNVNSAFQGITIHLMTYLAIAAQVLLYLLLSVFLLKWVWRAVKWMWRGEFRANGRR